MKKSKRNKQNKNESQAKKGKIRATDALRDEKGRFVTNKCPAGEPAGTSSPQPAEMSSPQPAESPAYKNNNHINLDLYNKIGSESMEREKRPFEKYVEKAMEDEYRLQLITMRTGLPLEQRKAEIIEFFKQHVIVMGNEKNILTVKDAMNYFANFTRRGTATYKELVRQLQRQEEEIRQENQYRYEEVDPKTGERSYCGIPIPADAPPRPNENAVYLNGQWTV